MSQKNWKKLRGSKLTFTLVIAVYVVQNETVVVFSGTIQNGKFSFGPSVESSSNSSNLVR